MTDIFISARRGGGAPAEMLYGTVTFKPTLAHARSTSIVLPAPTTFDLINGEVVATNIQPTPEPVEGQIEWAYEVTFKDRHGKSYSFLVGVPDSTTQVNFTTLPRYFETKPPLFGQGPQGEQGEAATVAVGSVTSGTTPSVTNSGTNTDAVLDFVFPKGDKGDKGDGVNLLASDKPFTDAPSTYPDGLSIFSIGATAGGWPFGYATVVTDKRMAGRSVQTIYNITNTRVLQRTEQNNAWLAFKEFAWNDLATGSANGLMSSADKTKLDNIMTLGYGSKLPTDAPSTYPAGVSAGLFKSSDGWPNINGRAFANVVTIIPRSYNTALQIASGYYNTEDSLTTPSDILFRNGSTTGGWTDWQTLATDTLIKAKSGVVIASDYPTVQDAVNAAFETKRPLLVDQDLTASAIDSKFFQIQTEGKGSITVGGNKFWVNPQHMGIQTNRLYINPTTGNDLNSGIDPSKPIKTFSRLNIYMSMLREKLLDGFWEIIIQSGIHSLTQGWRMDGLRTKWPLVIKGEGTLNTIIDGSSDTLGKFIYFKHFETSIIVQNILVRNYKGEGAAGDGIDTNAGIVVQGPGSIRIEDCRFVSCTTCVSIGYAASGIVLRSSFLGDLPRSTLSSVHTGIVALYGASVTVGTQGNGNTFTYCYQGVHLTRNAVAHVDFNTHNSCFLGLSVSHNARGAVIDGQFYSNNVGIDMTGGGECTFATADFGSGSTANLEHNVRFAGTSRFTQFQGQYPSTAEYRLFTSVNVPPITATSGVGRTLVSILPSSNNIPANLLYGLNKKIRFTVAGNISGTGSRKYIWRKSDRTGGTPSDLATVTIPSGYTGNFYWESEVFASAVGGNFRIINKVYVNGQPPIVTTEYVTALDLSHDWLFRLYKEDAVDGLTNQVITYEVYVSG